MNAIPSHGVSIRTVVSIPLGNCGTPDFATFNGFASNCEHFAICFARKDPSAPPLVRVHSECITGDLFGSLRCDCGEQLNEAMQLMAGAGGYLLYLRQEGRGIGLYNKLDAYHLQSQGLDTYEANRYLNLPEDGRDYACAVDMLNALGVRRIRLLSNNPGKSKQLASLGIEIVETLKTGTYVNQHNKEYLRAKANQTSHTLLLTDFPVHINGTRNFP